MLMILSVAACQSDRDLETALVGMHDGQITASTKPVDSTDRQAGSTRSTLLEQDKFDPKAFAKTSLSTGKFYYIDFRSRYALSYGHAYVVFGRLNSRGQPVDAEVAGLAPKSDSSLVYTLGHIVPVESSTDATDGDLEYEYMTAIWRVMLTKPEYDKVVADIRRLQAQVPIWHAVLYNCNAFVGDVAVSMGYRTSIPWLRPQQYINHLRKRNGGPDTIGWKASTDWEAPGLS
jgi:hypothetical protein